MTSACIGPGGGFFTECFSHTSVVFHIKRAFRKPLKARVRGAERREFGYLSKVCNAAIVL